MSAMTSKATVVWLRDELRLHDNALLAEAARRGVPVLPVFCLDPRVFDAQAKCDLGSASKTGARRAKFVLESLEDLRGSLKAVGSGLLVRRGSPQQVLADIKNELGHVGIICSAAACEEEQKDEAKVEQVAPLTKVWEGTMYHRNDLEDIPFKDQFTAWKNAVEKAETPVRRTAWADPGPRGLPPPPACAGLEDALPSLTDLGYGDASVDKRGDFFDPKGGETAALARLQQFVWDEDRLKTYFETRNGMVGQGYSTKFAPGLARGCVSPRRIAHECARYERERVANKSTYWVKFELTWRDFFVFYAHKHASRLFYPYGVKGSSQKWRKDNGALKAWKEGRTGAPLVDANMRELLATGFMSNRGRQNVASFLVHDLGLDWRLGAEHFEEYLVDYTPESNYGNWHAAAGLSGGRVNRFNILKQSKDYDADGKYVKLWLPELAKVPAGSVHTPWVLSPSDRDRLGAADYPPPLKTLGFSGGGKGKPPPKKAKGGDRDKIRKERRSKQRSRVQASYLE